MFFLFNFSEIFSILLWIVNIFNSAKKSKNILLDKKQKQQKKNQLIIETAKPDQFLPLILF